MDALRYRPIARAYQRLFTTAYRAHEAEIDLIARLPRVLRRSVPAFPTRFGVGLDIGAGVGPYSLLLRRHCTRVVACEPNADQAAFLRRTLGDTVDVAEVAVSDREGWAELRDDSAVTGWRRPLARLADDSTDVGGSGVSRGWRQRCRVTTIDTLLTDLGLAEVPGALVAKIDVEGHELEVLDGMQHTLAAHPASVLVVEIEPSRNPRAAVVFERLAAIGFHRYCYRRRRLTPCPEPVVTTPPPPSHRPNGRFSRFSETPNNFVFVRTALAEVVA